LIPLNEVTWIEADDYCVKIHTERKAYSMRKSMKSLEEQLASYRFIRVHRGALLNLGYLDHVDFESSLIKLQDSSELPLSKSGAQVLRKALKENSI
jgi:DNA-binding LytR/AlgR family response regulator